MAAPAHGWRLDAGPSQLGAARHRVGDTPAMRAARVAHPDTGYDPDHPTLPAHLRPDLGRNFAGGDPADATDPGRHSSGDQPGHGATTPALLAGGPYGGAPFAEVVPVRIATAAVHFRTCSMAAGLDHAAAAGAWAVWVSRAGCRRRPPPWACRSTPPYRPLRRTT